MAIACARLYAVVLEKRPWLLAALLPVTAAQLFAGMPTIVTPRESWVFRGAHYSDWPQAMAALAPRAALMVIGSFVAGWIALLLWRERAPGASR
jgi:hypothetical protein